MAFRIEPTFYDYHAVYAGDVKVGIIFPADHTGARYLYPNPDAFPGLMFEGLPAPFKPEFESFPSLDAIAAHLGIPADAREALAA